MSIGVERWINISAFKLEEDLLPDIGVVRVYPIKISYQEHELIGAVQSSPCTK